MELCSGIFFLTELLFAVLTVILFPGLVDGTAGHPSAQGQQAFAFLFFGGQSPFLFLNHQGFLLSGYQPGMFLNTVNRYKGQQDRCSLHIILISRHMSVILVLADLQPPGAAEHDINDTDIT